MNLLFNKGDTLHHNNINKENTHGKIITVYDIGPIHYDCYNHDRGILILIQHDKMHKHYHLSLSNKLKRL